MSSHLWVSPGLFDYMIESKLKIRVSYADTDQMGIVYYARYFEYFERGRTELLRELGLPYRELEARGIALPVVTAYCEYRRSAKYDDIIVVKTFINEPPGARIRMDYELFDETEKTLLAKGYTIHPFVDRSGKPVKPPKDFIKLVRDKGHIFS